MSNRPAAVARHRRLKGRPKARRVYLPPETKCFFCKEPCGWPKLAPGEVIACGECADNIETDDNGQPFFSEGRSG